MDNDVLYNPADDEVVSAEDKLRVNSALTAVCSAIVADDERRTASLVTEARAKLAAMANYGVLAFSGEVVERLNEAVDLLVADAVKRHSSVVVDVDALRDAYRYLGVIVSHVEQLLRTRIPDCPASTQAQTIVDAYVRSITTGELAHFAGDQTYMPKFGSFNQWATFCRSVAPLLRGKVEGYLEAHDELLTARVRVYKHHQHSWFARMKDNSKLLIDVTWDDAYESTPAGRVHGNFYHFDARVARPAGYPFTGDDLLGRLTCNVPVGDVVHIFKETKIVDV